MCEMYKKGFHKFSLLYMYMEKNENQKQWAESQMCILFIHLLNHNFQINKRKEKSKTDCYQFTGFG